MRERIEADVLESFLPGLAAYVADEGRATLVWSGAEPTLAGVGFLDWVADLEERLPRPRVRLGNVLATNGLLIDAVWAEFLARRGFLVRLSLDGPSHLHDAARRDARGEPSFTRVRRALDLLVSAGVPVSAVWVVGPHNVERGREVMSFFVEAGVPYLDLVPALDEDASDPSGPARYLISSEAFGSFLVEAFETWWTRGRPGISVRPFDRLVQSQVGGDVAPCAHGARCEGPVVLDVDGSLYPCEHYVHPAWRLGNVLETPLRRMLEGDERAAFRAQKRALPDACARCTWRALCNGGCFRNRLIGWDGDRPDLLCDGYRRLWTFVDAHLGID